MQKTTASKNTGNKVLLKLQFFAFTPSRNQ